MVACQLTVSPPDCLSGPISIHAPNKGIRNVRVTETETERYFSRCFPLIASFLFFVDWVHVCP
jgi:hypothetical protein